MPQTPPNPAMECALLAVALQRQLDGRKVDVRLGWPGLTTASSDRVALRERLLH